MAKPGKYISGRKILISKLLHPVPVFFIVAALSVVVYTVPNLRQTYQSSSTSIFGITTLVLNIIIPVVIGLIAAFGVYFGLSDLRRKVGDHSGAATANGSYTPDDRSRAIARNLPTAAVTLDVNGKVTFLNPFWMYFKMFLWLERNILLTIFCRTSIGGNVCTHKCKVTSVTGPNPVVPFTTKLTNLSK